MILYNSNIHEKTQTKSSVGLSFLLGYVFPCYNDTYFLTKNNYFRKFRKLYLYISFSLAGEKINISHLD